MPRLTDSYSQDFKPLIKNYAFIPRIFIVLSSVVGRVVTSAQQTDKYIVICAYPSVITSLQA